MVLFVIALILFSFMPANAQLPADLEAILKKELGTYKERLDLVISANNKQWLLIKPVAEQAQKEEITLVARTKDDDLLFSNDWVYTPIVNNSIKSFDYYPEAFQNALLKGKIYQEFIVPKGFELPRDLAFLAGRIPMKLGSIELASDRELLYKEKLQKLENKKPFEFLAYSYNSGRLTEISIDKKSNEKVGDSKDFNADALGLKYLSSIQDLDNEIYFSDLVTGTIFQLKKTRESFDATKPSETKNSTEPKAKETQLEEIFKLEDIGVFDGIRDFRFNLNKSYLYLVTKNTHNLLIIDYKKKLLTKKLELPSMIDGFQLISRSAQEPDKIVFFSKAKDRIFFLNTYDLRISDEIKLSELSKDSSYVPYCVLVSYDKVFLGVERTPKLPGLEASAGLMVFDTITNAFQEFVELEAVPKKLLLSNDKKSVYILMENQSGVKLSKIKVDDYSKEAQLELDADIAQVNSMTEIVGDSLLAVPSSVSSNIVLIDTDKLVALKKIELEERVNVLKVIR